MAPYGTGHVSGCGGGCRPWARGLHAPLLHHMTPSIAATRPSWQDMYAQRPRLLFHGVYISKTSYMREGEPVSRCQCVCVCGVVMCGVAGHGPQLQPVSPGRVLSIHALLPRRHRAGHHVVRRPSARALPASSSKPHHIPAFQTVTYLKERLDMTEDLGAGTFAFAGPETVGVSRRCVHARLSCCRCVWSSLRRRGQWCLSPTCASARVMHTCRRPPSSRQFDNAASCAVMLLTDGHTGAGACAADQPGQQEAPPAPGLTVVPLPHRH